MENRKHAELMKYLFFIRDTLKFQISIKDMSGFIPHADAELAMNLLPFMLHTNPYCVYTKSDENVCKKCSAMIPRIYKKIQKNSSPFFGICHAGVGEYIIPVISAEDHVLGFITVGSFRTGAAVSEHLIQKVCRNSTLRSEESLHHYAHLPSKPPYSAETVADAFSLVVKYFVDIYNNYKSQNKNLPKTHYDSGEDMILDKIVTFIRNHYTSKLNVSMISEACQCSNSYISHIFKKKTGVTVKTYINWLRVERAKEYFLSTHESITAISAKVGFDDSNYFTKVFYAQSGMTPTEYLQHRRLGHN